MADYDNPISWAVLFVCCILIGIHLIKKYIAEEERKEKEKHIDSSYFM